MPWHAAAEPLTFATDIQPLLERSCLPCHNATKAEGGLILESPKAMLEGGDTGPAIKPKRALESLIYETAAKTKKPFMPPEANKAKAPHLTPEQLDILRRWINDGAQGNPRERKAVAWTAMPQRVVGVSAIALTLDGQFAAAGRGSGVTLYNLSVQREAGRFEAHPDLVTSLAFSPDGTLLATGSRGEVKLWKKAIEPSIALPDSATRLASSPDGKLQAEAAPSQPAILRRTADQNPIASLAGDWELQASVARADLERSGAKFELEFLEKQAGATRELITKTTADLEKAQKEHNALLPKRDALKKAESDSVSKRDALMLRRDAADDAFVAETRNVETLKRRLEDADQCVQKVEAQLKAAAPEARQPAEQSLDAARLESKKAADDKAAADAKLKAAKATLDASQKEYAEAVKALGAAAGAVSSAKTAELNLTNLKEVLGRAKKDMESQSGAIEKAKTVLEKAESQRAALIEQSSRYRCPEFEALSFTEEGDVILSRHADGRVRAWNSKTGEPLPSPAVSPRWELVLTLGSSLTTDSPLANRVNALAFSPDGSLLATGSGDPSRSGEIKLWNPHTGSLVLEMSTPHKDAVLSLDFSRDGRLLASGGADRAVRVWEVTSGKLFRNLEAHGSHVLSVAFRDDARRVASASADNTAKIWDVQNSDVIATFSTFSKEVNFVRYLGRGEELAAASGAPALRILKDGGGEVRGKTEGITRFITAAAVTADGQLHLVGDVEGTLLILNREGKPLAKWAPPPPSNSR
jgi:WD40 repeat protein